MVPGFIFYLGIEKCEEKGAKFTTRPQKTDRHDIDHIDRRVPYHAILYFYLGG